MVTLKDVRISGEMGETHMSLIKESDVFADHADGGSVVGFFTSVKNLSEGVRQEMVVVLEICETECTIETLAGDLVLTEKTRYGSQLIWNILGV